MTFNLAIELRYTNGYGLDGFEREGIGVYLGNLIRQLLTLNDHYSIYLVVNPEHINNLRTFLRCYNVNNSALIVCTGDTHTLLESNYKIFNLFHESRVQFLDESLLDKCYKKYDLKVSHWIRSLRKRKSMQIVFKGNIKLDAIFEATDNIKIITIALEVKSRGCPTLNVNSSSVTIGGSGEAKLHETLVVNSLDIEDNCDLQLSLYVDKGIAKTLVVSNIVIELCCIDPSDNLTIDHEETLNVSTRLNNSRVDAVLFHHINTYHSKYLKKCIYHLHDLLFFEHASKYFSSGLSHDWVSNNMLQCYEAVDNIKDNSLVLFSSRHVEYKHFKQKFPYKHSRVKTSLVRNTFLSSEFASFTREPSIDTRNKLFSFYPYVTYPTQPRPTKQFRLLFEIVDGLRQIFTELKLVLTCSRESFAHHYSGDIPEYVHFVGALSREDLYHLYSNSLAGIVTSCYEASLPWQFLEGLMANTISVCYRSEIVEEFIEQNLIDEDIAASTTFLSANEAITLLTELISNRFQGLPGRYSPQQCLNSLKRTLPSLTWQDIATAYSNEIQSFTYQS